MADKYALRRWFIRDILLKYIGFRLLVKPNVEGLDNIPASGPTILMMNHTVSIDGVVVMGVVKSRFVVPMIKAENFDHWFIGPLARMWGAYAIKRGEVDLEAMKLTLELINRGDLVLIAPEGHRQGQLHDPKDGLTYIALKTNAVIVPTATFNMETWVKDLYRPRLTQAQIRFGKPFRLKAKGRMPREAMREATHEMMYQLATLLPEKYRGDYRDLSQMTTNHLEFIS
ncbi:MAG: 1-acyl-sn-glycerol-3-phosphate acyltransferase [Anaerolineae bacterium]|nr:MAG: 1-acyl-sn-glycerol-3-phosphate acyltransferase [Anaerolineae bacterium]